MKEQKYSIVDNDGAVYCHDCRYSTAEDIMTKLNKTDIINKEIEIIKQ